ncbi:MAG: FHA domain-containing protein [Planctomycetota bacterium]
MLIGRSRRCDLRLHSHRVSRRHCTLEPRGEGFFLRDLGSRNGTWRDGERFEHGFLRVGDRFVVGDVILRVRPGGELLQEGLSDPRSVLSGPRLTDHLPALIALLLPITGVLLLVSTSGPAKPAPRASEAARLTPPPTDPVQGRAESDRAADLPRRSVPAASSAPPVAPPSTRPPPTTSPAAPSSLAAPPSLAAPSLALPAREPARPGGTPAALPLGELWAVAAECDRARSARRAAAEGEELPASRERLRQRIESGPPTPEPSGALLGSRARAELVQRLVEPALASLERSEGADGDGSELLALIDLLGDLGGRPAREALRVLREEVEERLARSYRAAAASSGLPELPPAGEARLRIDGALLRRLDAWLGSERAGETPPPASTPASNPGGSP